MNMAGWGTSAVTKQLRRAATAPAPPQAFVPFHQVHHASEPLVGVLAVLACIVSWGKAPARTPCSSSLSSVSQHSLCACSFKVRHALDLLVDVIAIFVRILVILLNNAAKEEERKRKEEQRRRR